MLTYDYFSTSFGQLTVVKSERGICYIALPSNKLANIRSWLRRFFPDETLTSAPAPFERERQELREYLQGRRKQFSFPLDHRNSPFSIKVLEEVCRVPYGATATYGTIARRIGYRRAARAIGNALAANPLALAIPCHRIIGTDGSLTGYSGGIALKAQLMDLESRGS